MRFLSIILSVILFLPSCVKEETNSIDGGNPKYVWLTSNISIEISNDPIKRSVIEGANIPVNSEIGVFALRTNNEEQASLGARINGDVECEKFLENVEYVVESQSGSMQQENLPQWPSKVDGYEGLTFYAYYPHNEYLMDYEITDDDDIEDSYYMTTELNVTDMSKTIDYLYTGKIYWPTPENELERVDLTFKHALSRIKFVVKSTSEDITSTVNNIVVNAYCGKKGYFYIADGTCRPTSTSQQSYTYPLEKQINKQSPVEANFLLYPNVKIRYIRCKINGTQYTVYDETSDNVLITLTKGKYITFNITFSPKPINLGNVVSEWEASPEDNRDIHIDEVE